MRLFAKDFEQEDRVPLVYDIRYSFTWQKKGDRIPVKPNVCLISRGCSFRWGAKSSRRRPQYVHVSNFVVARIEDFYTEPEIVKRLNVIRNSFYKALNYQGDNSIYLEL